MAFDTGMNLNQPSLDMIDGDPVDLDSTPEQSMDADVRRALRAGNHNEAQRR